MTWPPQSPNLNPIEMVWDESDRRVKEKQQKQTSAVSFQVKLVERMPTL
jgi:hypothetical protein